MARRAQCAIRLLCASTTGLLCAEPVPPKPVKPSRITPATRLLVNIFMAISCRVPQRLTPSPGKGRTIGASPAARCKES